MKKTCVLPKKSVFIHTIQQKMGLVAMPRLARDLLQGAAVEMHPSSVGLVAFESIAMPLKWQDDGRDCPTLV